MKHILIIDDDATFKEIMKASFDEKLYTVALASEGKAGLEQVAAQKPDLILLDIKMPGMDGIEFLKQMNEKYGMGATPVLITSNMSSIDTISEGVSLGVRGYVVKAGESLQGIIDSVERVLKAPVHEKLS